jgi:hypothetical protein
VPTPPLSPTLSGTPLPLFPRCLHLSVGLGVDRMGHFRGILQPLQQAVDPTQGVARSILLRDPISNLPSGPDWPVATASDTWISSSGLSKGCRPRPPILCPITWGKPPVDTKPSSAALIGSGCPLPLPPYPSATHSGAATSRATGSGLRDPALFDRRPSTPLLYPTLAKPPQRASAHCTTSTSAIPTIFMASIN